MTASNALSYLLQQQDDQRQRQRADAVAQCALKVVYLEGCAVTFETPQAAACFLQAVGLYRATVAGAQPVERKGGDDDGTT